MVRQYLVQLTFADGKTVGEVMEGQNPVEATKRYIRACGGGIIADISVTQYKGIFDNRLLKKTECFAVVDLLGGTRENRSYYICRTRNVAFC